MQIGKALRLARTAKSMTQKELAQRVGCTANYLSIVERGDGNPSLGLVEKLARELGMATVEILALAADDADAGDPLRREVVRKLQELLVLLGKLDE